MSISYNQLFKIRHLIGHTLKVIDKLLNGIADEDSTSLYDSQDDIQSSDDDSVCESPLLHHLDMPTLVPAFELDDERPRCLSPMPPTEPGKYKKLQY